MWVPPRTRCTSSGGPGRRSPPPISAQLLAADLDDPLLARPPGEQPLGRLLDPEAVQRLAVVEQQQHALRDARAGRLGTVDHVDVPAAGEPRGRPQLEGRVARGLLEREVAAPGTPRGWSGRRPRAGRRARPRAARRTRSPSPRAGGSARPRRSPRGAGSRRARGRRRATGRRRRTGRGRPGRLRVAAARRSTASAGRPAVSVAPASSKSKPGRNAAGSSSSSPIGRMPCDSCSTTPLSGVAIHVRSPSWTSVMPSRSWRNRPPASAQVREVAARSRPRSGAARSPPAERALVRVLLAVEVRPVRHRQPHRPPARSRQIEELEQLARARSSRSRPRGPYRSATRFTTHTATSVYAQPSRMSKT